MPADPSEEVSGGRLCRLILYTRALAGYKAFRIPVGEFQFFLHKGFTDAIALLGAC